MGVLYSLRCSECKTWADGHKCKSLHDATYMYPDNNRDYNLGYWDYKMFWFLWKHKDHGIKVECVTDCEDEKYYYTIANYREEAPN